MAAFIEVLRKMNDLGLDEKSTYQIINSNLMQSSKGTKRSPAFLKIAVPDETVSNFLRFDDPDQLGILVMVDRKSFLDTNNKIDKTKEK